MRFEVPFHRSSLKARLIWSYLVILGIGGLATSVVGSWIVSSTIMRQARRSVDRDLAMAKTLYEQQLQTLRHTVQLTGSGALIQQYLLAGDMKSLAAYLENIRRESGFDLLSLTDRHGRVVLRTRQPDRVGDDVSRISPIRAALAGEVAAGTEIVPAGFLENENAGLRERAHIHLLPTPLAKPVDKTEETSGMVLLASAPVRGASGGVLGALYAGVLLNRNLGIVDRVWELVFKGDRYEDREIGTVTVFQNDLRISTTVKTESGERAVGTRVSREVSDAVLNRGETWRGRAFVVNDWYISAYDPIVNHEGRVIGVLYVGVLEEAYTAIRDRVILSFFGLATGGFILIIGITYYMIRSITQPIVDMVAVTHNIAAGRFDQEVPAGSPGEVGLLAESFNTMLKSLRQMKGDLEEWGRTLEEKVKHRTAQLVSMQARVAQSERLASLGMLAAGVAHEINNPLGGILALTALSLEEMKEDDPNRENLQEVLKQTERCRDIVKGLLEFSRESEISTEPVNLNRILQETLSLVAKQAHFFNVNVIKNWDEQLPPAMADRSQLQQVFLNVIMNAVQAMQEKGTLTIATRRSAGDSFVEVQISDTGPGLAPEEIDHVFDPFFTTKPSGHGTGLGLSIAYGIVRKHNGTISVESEVGKGSAFTIRLPTAPPSQG